MSDRRWKSRSDVPFTSALTIKGGEGDKNTGMLDAAFRVLLLGAIVFARGVRDILPSGAASGPADKNDTGRGGLIKICLRGN